MIRTLDFSNVNMLPNRKKQKDYFLQTVSCIVNHSNISRLDAFFEFPEYTFKLGIKELGDIKDIRGVCISVAPSVLSNTSNISYIPDTYI